MWSVIIPENGKMSLSLIIIRLQFIWRNKLRQNLLYIVCSLCKFLAKKVSVDLNFQLQVFASECSGTCIHPRELSVIILQKTVCKLNKLVNSYAAFQ